MGKYRRTYNVKDQLIKAIIQKPNQMKEEWQYQYDVLGRRTSKVQLENGKILAESQIDLSGTART